MLGSNVVDDPQVGAVVVDRQRGRIWIDAYCGRKHGMKGDVGRAGFICESRAVANNVAGSTTCVTNRHALLPVVVAVAVSVPIPRAAASMAAVVVAISGGVRSGEQRVLLPKEANFLCGRCDGGEGGRGRGGDVDLYGLGLHVNAEVVDHGLNLRLGGDAGSYVFRPDGV